MCNGTSAKARRLGAIIGPVAPFMEKKPPHFMRTIGAGAIIVLGAGFLEIISGF